MASIIISNKIISGNFVGLFDYVYTKLIFFSFPCLEEVLILIAPWIENARVEKHLKLDHENAYKITLNAFNTEKQIIGINWLITMKKFQIMKLQLLMVFAKI